MWVCHLIYVKYAGAVKVYDLRQFSKLPVSKKKEKKEIQLSACPKLPLCLKLASDQWQNTVYWDFKPMKIADITK